MQIEKEDSNRIRIILKPVDLSEMNVSVESLKPNSPQLHNFLYEIMERIREETGFNPYSGQIMVEALPMGESMVLTVTRISENKEALKDKMKSKPKKVRAVINRQFAKRTAFIFESFDDLCSALVKLDSETVKMSDYYQKDKKNILIVGAVSMQERYMLKEYSEYSKSGSMVDSYLREHAKHIAGGDKLAQMACGIAKLGV